ncbi:hypothetical protein OG203_16615 [Nocardia sp. NBC_01499]|uniref:hypothetical protein n=1 Tax=Nocardia sp. NBC_01499 TaxID=2903597 RepID=UPI00386ECC3D
MAAELRLPQPFSVERLCQIVAERRGRELILHSLTRATQAGEQPPLRGLCARTDRADFLFFQDRTTAPHRDHIIVHELAHFLCGHTIFVLDTPPDRPTDDQLVLGAVHNMLGPTGYSTVQEREAEMLASLIFAPATNPVTPPSAGMLGGLEAALGYRRRMIEEFGPS